MRALFNTPNSSPTSFPPFLLPSPDQNLSWWGKEVLQKAPSALASIHIRSQALGERREGRRGGVEIDWASAREQWVSLWVGVRGWRERKRNPVESFWRRMLSSPPGLTGMHCRCGCYRQRRVIWWEIIRGGSRGHPTYVHAHTEAHIQYKWEPISPLLLT